MYQQKVLTIVWLPSVQMLNFLPEEVSRTNKVANPYAFPGSRLLTPGADNVKLRELLMRVNVVLFLFL